MSQEPGYRGGGEVEEVYGAGARKLALDDVCRWKIISEQEPESCIPRRWEGE